jgi:hypothetical protein
MFINVAECRKLCHDRNKQLSSDAIEQLNFRVQAILNSAVVNVGGFKRITATEIEHTK